MLPKCLGLMTCFLQRNLHIWETGGRGIGAGMAHTASADVLQLKQLLVLYFINTFLILLARQRGLTSRSCISASFRHSLYDLQCPPARATYTAISIITKSSAPSSVDTLRLPKELCTRKKGKAFNFLSLITKVKLEILQSEIAVCCGNTEPMVGLAGVVSVFGYTDMKKCPVFRAAISKTSVWLSIGCASNPSPSLCCKCSRSQSVGWGVSRNNVSVTQSEILGREELLGWMRIYLLVQRVNQSRGRYPHFMHWVILLCAAPEMLC